MDLSIDHTIEYLVWDDTFSGSLEINRNGNQIAIAIEVIMRGPWTRKLDSFGAGNMDGQIVQFTIPDILLNPDQAATDQVIPLRDDVLVDDNGKRWTFVHSEQSVVDTHWYVAAVPERIAG